MNEDMLMRATPLDKSYNLNKPKVVKKLLKKTWSGLYSCTNEHGEDVIIVRKVTFHKKGKAREIKGNGMEVWVFQGNGHLYFAFYNENGQFVDGQYKGKY